METKHTPTPWAFFKKTIQGADHSHVGMVTEFGEVPPEVNAAFIVRAVNNHEALVGALQTHHDWCVKNQEGYFEHGDDAVAFRSTRNILAAAKGEA